ncbi:hypothetical protein O9G_003315 [Rozella allomycis CSF55]|uniref:Vps41 beta-propeller domain-containing protein n=1 Tax=Rozella allomycis (strain CSF55) TaxID=988480 RepID=A0A075B4S5_ROZAC|nr:hypothetical protein O9G_003315 [Rozella allomycis CSF55]|eukprot:EPZ36444.1 hypothetical protein O9G_003315 [Rozella allomycis CSF55]
MEKESISPNKHDIENEYPETIISQMGDFDEPLIKYKKLDGSFKVLMDEKSASFTSLKVSEKYIMCGTDRGAILILDLDGNLIKKFDKHIAKVNCIDVDGKQEFVASCGDDGKAFIYSLNSNNVYEYFSRSPLLSISLEPNYSSSKTFAFGGVDGNLYLNEKSWLGHKDKILHNGQGPVRMIKWRENFIAWIDKQIKVFDLSNGRINVINDESSECSQIAWDKDGNLIIADGNNIQICFIKVIKYFSNKMKNIVRITKSFHGDFESYGLGLFQSKICILSIAPEENIQRPEIILMDFEGDEISNEVLLLPSYKQTNFRYQMEFLQSGELFYVIGERDIISGSSRSFDDHIEWLCQHNLYEKAILEIKAQNQQKDTNRLLLIQIGEKYFENSFDLGQFSEAARMTPVIFSDDSALWEIWVKKFCDRQNGFWLMPYIPLDNPRLPPPVYQAILNDCLKNNQSEFLEAIKIWPIILYNISELINAVEESLIFQQDNKILLTALAKLLTLNGQHEQAIICYLKLRDPDVFKIVLQFDLFDCIENNINLLLLFENSMGLDFLIHYYEKFSVDKIVKCLETHKDCLLKFLDEIYWKDSTVALKYHDLQLELYCELDRPKIIQFLRTSNYYSIEKAFSLCKSLDLTEEMIFLLGRMGNFREALKLIIEKIKDPQAAIDFAKEQEDDQLWEDLVNYSVDKPEFIVSLLHNLGGKLEAKNVVLKIPSGMNILDLKESLLSILSDYRLQLYTGKHLPYDVLLTKYFNALDCVASLATEE